MALALSPELPPGLLSRLIVADIAPSKGALSQEFRNYTDAMQRIEQSQVTTRKAANDIIHEVESVGYGDSFEKFIFDIVVGHYRTLLSVPFYSPISHLRTEGRL